MSVTELQALITLLEDPDEGIYTTVKQELEKIGEAAVPPLRRALEEEGHGTVFVERAKALLDQLATEEVRVSSPTGLIPPNTAWRKPSCSSTSTWIPLPEAPS